MGGRVTARRLGAVPLFTWPTVGRDLCLYLISHLNVYFGIDPPPRRRALVLVFSSEEGDRTVKVRGKGGGGRVGISTVILTERLREAVRILTGGGSWRGPHIDVF